MKIRQFYLDEQQQKHLQKEGYVCVELVLPAKSVVIEKKKNSYFYKEWIPTKRNLDKFTRLKRCEVKNLKG